MPWEQQKAGSGRSRRRVRGRPAETHPSQARRPAPTVWEDIARLVQESLAAERARKARPKRRPKRRRQPKRHLSKADRARIRRLRHEQAKRAKRDRKARQRAEAGLQRKEENLRPSTPPTSPTPRKRVPPLTIILHVDPPRPPKLRFPHMPSDVFAAQLDRQYAERLAREP